MMMAVVVVVVLRAQLWYQEKVCARVKTSDDDDYISTAK